MYRTAALLGATFLAGTLRPARSQQVGTSTAETHPKLQVSTCTTSGGCTTSQQSIVLDANWRWLHNVTGYTNCYTGNTWDATLCPDDVTCAANCALDGADYSGTYGISTSGNALTLKFVTNGANKNIGSRVYLMAPDDTNYQTFQLLNKEFAFDVDVSNLPCGLNGALYFSHMEADGGLSEHTGNKAGAKYGTGYCDAQCPHDLKFINGLANVEGWTPSTSDPNAGSGTYGACCSEMDVWESNQYATAYTPHPCSVSNIGPYRCSGTDCGDGSDRYSGVCDKDGCDFNSWRMGNQTFFGPGLTIDTKSKLTVVTQFITDSGTATGNLKEIRRLYVQNSKVIANSNVNIAGIDPVNSITDSFCTEQKSVFGDTNAFSTKGGLTQMGKALSDGMVLVMSLWDDHAANCLWLDSDYPTTGDPSKPGVSRGPCSTSSGVPANVEAEYPNSSVTYSNIKWGDIGSTYTGTGSGSSSSSSSGSSSSTAKPSSTSTSQAASTTTAGSTTGAVHYAQCGGTGWTGATACQSPYTCTVLNPYYSQCL